MTEAIRDDQMESKLHAGMSELLNLFTFVTTIKNRGGNRKMLKILYKRNSHLEIVNRSIKNCKHSCLFEQLFYRSSHWVSLEFQKTGPTGLDLFGTPDLELGIHNSKIKRQESALWPKKKRGTQNSKKIQISDFLLYFSVPLLQEVTTKTTLHYKSTKKIEQQIT